MLKVNCHLTDSFNKILVYLCVCYFSSVKFKSCMCVYNKFCKFYFKIRNFENMVTLFSILIYNSKIFGYFFCFKIKFYR